MRESHVSLVRYSNLDGTVLFHVRYEVTFHVGLLYVDIFLPRQLAPAKSGNTEPYL